MVKEFDKFSDFSEINEWFRARGEETKITRLPKRGWIKHGVCACFIYWDETSTVAFIHGLISNPKASSKEIYLAMNEMLKLGLPKIKEEGIEALIFSTAFSGIQSIAKEFGFVENETAKVLVKHV